MSYRKQQSLEFEGIGKFELYPVKKKNKGFPRVTEEGKKVKRKRKKKGERSEYGYFDDEGNEYSKDELFWEIGDKKLPKIERTKVVKEKNTEKVDKAGIIGDFMSSGGYYIAKPESEAVRKLAEERIENDKALKYRRKKSSSGSVWWREYLCKYQGEFVIFSGIGFLSEAIEKFREQMREQEEGDKAKRKIKQEVTVSAEEVESEVAEAIAV